jgi:hypothetical protein
MAFAKLDSRRASFTCGGWRFELGELEAAHVVYDTDPDNDY